MSRTLRARGALRRAGVGLSLAVMALALAGCASSVPTTDAPSSIPPSPTALATWARTAGGTWATVAMGHLDHPLDTFWQLLHRPLGAVAWTDEVEPTATATNGGLVLATSPPDDVAVGILPSYDLTFTPIVSTANSGHSWSAGLFDHEMVPAPNAFAIGPGGRALAIAARGRHGDEVFTSMVDLSSWKPLVTASVLDSAPHAAACSPRGISAVGFVRGTVVIGAACARPGRAGLFTDHAEDLAFVGPHLSPPLSHDLVAVLGLDPVRTGLVALLGLSGHHQTELIASWTADGTSWQDSLPLHVAHGQRLVSYGPTAGGGIFALLAGRKGDQQLDTVGEPAGTWHPLPAPPPDTATIAYPTGGGANALAVHGTVLTVWQLLPASDRPASDRWSEIQVLHVPIQFGSSNP